MNSKKIAVLGCGLIGKTIAADHCQDYDVVSADNNSERLNKLKSPPPVKII
jgi:saccharopine dehydrogenase-like NADP-dependent oxidoreductase